MMEKEENQQSFSPMPVLSRLDRLEHLVQYLQDEKQGISKRQWPGSTILPTMPYSGKSCKPLSIALDDLHIKGSLLDRITMLENSVLQLSLAMEEEITSSSSSSAIACNQDNIAHCLPAKQDSVIVVPLIGDKQNHEPGIEAEGVNKAQGYNKNRRTIWKVRCRFRKWFRRTRIKVRLYSKSRRIVWKMLCRFRKLLGRTHDR